MIDITIAICTFNRCELLEQCLTTFTPEYQSQTQVNYEVLVIDNNSTDNTPEVVERFSDGSNVFRRVFEPTQGLSHARNRGCKEAVGEWIVFIDDDAKARSNYIDKLNEILGLIDADCFGGPCLPIYPEAKPKWYKDSYHLRIKIDQFGVLTDDFIGGGNIVLRKSTLLAVGGFSTELGMDGDRVAYGEETEVQIKIKDTGGNIYYAPDLVVEHLIDTYKLNIRWFVRSSYARGRDHWVAFRETPTWLSILELLVSMIYSTLKHLFLRTKQLFTDKEYYAQNFTVDILSGLAYKMGKLTSGLKLSLSKN